MKKFLTLTLLSLGIMVSAQKNVVHVEIPHSDALIKENPLNPVPQKIELSTGVDLEYVEQGDPNGVPVIFLHGLSDSWHSFESVLRQLPRSIHAFAVSQRGHGDSERPASGYSPVEFSNDIAAFVRQKKLGPVVIAGHSMGGMNAQQFALDHPKLTKALVIIDSESNFNDNPGFPEFNESVQAMQGDMSKEFMTGFQKETLANPIDSTYFNLLVEEAMKCSLPVFKAALAELTKANLTKRLRSFNKPTLIIWGNKDSFCDRKGQVVLKEAIYNSTFIEYLGTGHALHWEQPESFAKDLVYFIEHKVRK